MFLDISLLLSNIVPTLYDNAKRHIFKNISQAFAPQMAKKQVEAGGDELVK